MKKEITTMKAYVIVPKKFYQFNMNNWEYDPSSMAWFGTRAAAKRELEDCDKIIEVTLSYDKQQIHKCNCTECTINK